jgi:tRNA U54 and U55 pseudouridine synthase Pus10
MIRYLGKMKDCVENKNMKITKKYYEENLEWRKELHLKNTYGITMEDKIKMRDYQNNKCYICENIFDNDKSAFVDHCHLTKKVRGLLCHHCNSGLGYFKDNVNYLKKAIQYLEK